jgi:hypothetical protein
MPRRRPKWFVATALTLRAIGLLAAVTLFILMIIEKARDTTWKGDSLTMLLVVCTLNPLNFTGIVWSEKFQLNPRGLDWHLLVCEFIGTTLLSPR